mmetsp:Transcript_29244/g.69680  ORF Transcript_29244/g.69680 Transcript_29244/m.69680 type:complete len:444 (+) Transcript_29244:222-1553(+)
MLHGPNHRGVAGLALLGRVAPRFLRARHWAVLGVHVVHPRLEVGEGGGGCQARIPGGVQLQAVLHGPGHRGVAVAAQHRVLAAIGSGSHGGRGCRHCSDWFSSLSCDCHSCGCCGCGGLSCGGLSCGGLSRGCLSRGFLSCGFLSCGGLGRGRPSCCCLSGHGGRGHSRGSCSRRQWLAVELLKVKVALGSLHLVLLGLVGELLFEHLGDLLHALDVLLGVVQVVPKGQARAVVQGLVELHAACVDKVMVAGQALDLVQSQGSHLLDAVGAVALTGGCVTAAPGLQLGAVRILLLPCLGGALPGQGEPLRLGIVGVVGREGEHAKVVATNEVPILLEVQLAVPRPGAHRGVEGEAHPEVHAQLLQRRRRLRGDLVADDLVDVELPRAHPHHLVVEIPQGARQVSHVDVLHKVVVLRGGAVHVEGIERRIAGLLQCFCRLVRQE